MGVEGRWHGYLEEVSEAAGWEVGAVAVAGVGAAVGAGGAVAGGSAAAVSLSGPVALLAACVFGGGLVRAVHGHALVAGALSGAGFAQRGDVSAAAGGVVGARVAAGGAGCVAGAAGGGGAVGLVAVDRGRVVGGGEKGGDKVARTLLGRPGSRYHLAVDASGRPLAVRLAAGNENERRHLLPLVDALLARGIQPLELWADRGYASRELEQALRARGIQPHISQPRRRGQAIAADTATREVWRGRRRRLRTADPQAHQRFPVERTNAWLKARRRIATRRDRKADNYLAFLQLGMLLILARSF